MMKEMQQAMNDMSEEDKRMMDSMGVKMPDLKNMQQMASFASANAGKAAPAVSVPKRDAARIAALPKTPLTTVGLPVFLQTVQQKLEAKLSREWVNASKDVYKAVRAKYAQPQAVATTAIGCWSFGRPQVALLLMNRACLDNPTDGDNLNNFAAMLSMCGGEQMALPILQLLNRQHPRNSTILNNIAHAWFGLGDVANASKYIDSTLRLCAWHPQANQIKAAIEESKGDHDAAVNALKQAISRMHTPEKERALHDLGYELKSEDIIWLPKNTHDQLGLSKFAWPGIPKSVEESEELEPVWNAFRSEWDARMKKLQATHELLQAEFQQAYQRRMQHDMQAAQTGSRSSAVMEGLVPKAIIKLRPYVDVLLEREAKEPFGVAVFALQDTLNQLKETAAKELKKVNETMAPGGEGSGMNPGYCAAVDAVNSKLLRDANSLVEAFCIRHRNRAKNRIRELVNFKFYSEFPEKFALSVNEAKIEWLSYVIMPKDLITFRNPNPFCRKKEPKKPAKSTGLAEYDDINCKYKSTLNLVVGTITTECGKTVAKIDIGGLDLGIAGFSLGWETKSADREENRNFLDEFQRGTIEVGVSKTKSLTDGPLQLQAEAGLTGFLEFDRTGITDAGVKVSASVKAAAETPKGPDGTSESGIDDIAIVSAGVEAKISINSGFTAERTGILK